LEEKHLLILLIVALSVVVLLVIMVVVNAMGKSDAKATSRKINNASNDTSKALRIEDLVDIAANRNSSKNELASAIMKVSQTFPFPKKTKGLVSRDGKVYLNFILLVASHRHADAKLVAFMNTELKKKNPDYTKEIDIYESEGLRQRGRRV
jgi:hypothetical protein